MKVRDVSLLDQIEDDVLCSRPLADALRKCVVLGGKAGSQDLRAWANQELKGYDDSADTPGYRTVGAPILVNAFVGNGQVKGQHLGVNGLPDFVRESGITDEFTFVHGVGKLESLIDRAAANGGHVHLLLPGSADVARIMNHEIGDPFQNITEIYWSVDQSAIEGIIDQIRNTLTELVAEMRAATPRSESVPTKAAVDQAVNVAVNGDHSILTVTTAQATDNGKAEVTSEPGLTEPGWWTRLRIAVAAVVGTFTVIGGAIAIAQWQGWI